jgi:small subunit ribosomal protein S5
MSEQENKKEITVDQTVETKTDVTPALETKRAFRPRNKRDFKKNKRRPSKRKERVKSEFDQKMLNIRRVTRVSSGGRRFTFSVAIAVGDKKGKVGVGIGKAGDTTLAIDKAVKNAKKNLIEVRRTKSGSIAHDIDAKYNSAKVIVIPAKGRGVVAGSAVRDVFELAGVTDVNAKILSGSKNKLNIARATVKALESLKN